MVIEFDNRDPFQGKSPSDFFAGLTNRLKKRVKTAYVFGSFAIGTPKPGSDLDLILVVETDLPFVERAREFFDLYEYACPLDILVYTPEEFESLSQDPSPGFWQEIVDTMVKIA